VYKVLDLVMNDHDFNLLYDISVRYETGRITLREFMEEARRLMRKYNKHVSEIWKYQYAVVTGNYIEYFYLLRAILRFRRPIRIPGDWKHYDYHWIQVTVFTIDPRWRTYDVTAVARQIIDELPTMWNAMGGGVTFVEEYSVYDPPEVLTPEDGFTAEKYEFLRRYLSEYDPIARNPANWENYRPSADFKNVEHILSHYIVCGVSVNKEISPDWKLLDTLLVESPCVEGEDFPVSESLTVYAGTDISQRCWLWKKSGWRVRGGKYFPPASGIPPTPRRPGRPPKAPEEKKEEEKPVRTKWVNPLRDYDVYKEAHPKFWDTLRVCKMYGLNPIPLLPDSKLPAIEWRYLTTEPIREEHLKFFKNKKYNIGIMAGYHNLMIVDMDVRLNLNLNTLTDITPRGNHYYFFVDRVIPGVAFKITEGKCKNKSPLGIKGYGYVVAPGSTYKGKKYEWCKIMKPMRVKSDALVKAFERFFRDNYEVIKRKFEPHCLENEGGR